MNNIYQPDILGKPFDRKTLTFPDDYEGEVIATLIRRRAESTTSKAILYIHGFNDYFFQAEFAKYLNNNGLDFYALDLRKYGRSWLPHQKLNNVRSLCEYNAEIKKAIEIIINEDHTDIFLMGHSTGGLIATNFLDENPDNRIKGLILNSPFYEFNASAIEKNLLIPFTVKMSKLFPNIKVNSKLSPLYGKSIHKDYEGEWDYNLTWKPIKPPRVNASFIGAVSQAHKKAQRGVTIIPPVLLLFSENSAQPKKLNRRVFISDIVLNVEHIQAVGNKINGDVQSFPITFGIHDLLLSRDMVRYNVYEKILNFINQK